jgi:hypothetical protein
VPDNGKTHVLSCYKYGDCLPAGNDQTPRSQLHCQYIANPFNMHIRPVTRNDISVLADIAVAAFRNDEMYSSFFPASAVESGAFRRNHLLRMRKRIVDVGMRGFVIESDENDDFWSGEKDILGYAFWSRAGTSEAARKWQTDSLYMSTIPSFLLLVLLIISNVIHRARKRSHRSGKLVFQELPRS